MIKTYCINGTWCRYYIAGDVYVSKDGTVAGKPAYKGKGCKPLSIIEDGGKKYIQVTKKKWVPLDLAVIKCFGKPKPLDSKRYMINHKDGDALNCDITNLEWVIQHYEHTVDESIDLRCCGKKITVFKDGHVEMDGKTLDVYDDIGSRDLDLLVAIDPYIVVHGEKNSGHFTMDKIMDVAGYVQGDDMILSYPQILHIDNDWKNFSSDNLMWVEYDDERFKTYQLKMKEDKHKRNVELNPRKPLPSNM